MKFGIPEHEAKIREAQEALKALASEKKKICVGINRKETPPAGEKEKLALWVLQSLGILGENDSKKHPAVVMFVEIIKKRKKGSGISGQEILSMVDVGKTQTYYWLKKMKDACLIDQGKKKVIEQGAKRTLKGFYLCQPTLGFTLAEMKKEVVSSIEDIGSVCDRLHDIISLEEKAGKITEQ
ncbi:hypothetical protein ACFLQI_01940 [Candidatus Undinarchaeota archaeon]